MEQETKKITSLKRPNWGDGSPTTDSEGWMYTRRTELLNIAISMYVSRAEKSEWSTEKDRNSLMEDCVLDAVSLRDLVESECPRLC